MVAKLAFRAPLLAGAMIVAMAGAAQAECGYHSASAEARAPLQSLAQLESEAQLEATATVDESETQIEAEAVETEATVQRATPRVVHVEVVPLPKPVPNIPIILGTYR